MIWGVQPLLSRTFFNQLNLSSTHCSSKCYLTGLKFYSQRFGESNFIKTLQLYVTLIIVYVTLIIIYVTLIILY